METAERTMAAAAAHDGEEMAGLCFHWTGAKGHRNAQTVALRPLVDYVYKRSRESRPALCRSIDRPGDGIRNVRPRTTRAPLLPPLLASHSFATASRKEKKKGQCVWWPTISLQLLLISPCLADRQKNEEEKVDSIDSLNLSICRVWSLRRIPIHPPIRVVAIQSRKHILPWTISTIAYLCVPPPPPCC